MEKNVNDDNSSKSDQIAVSSLKNMKCPIGAGKTEVNGNDRCGKEVSAGLNDGLIGDQDSFISAIIIDNKCEEDLNDKQEESTVDLECRSLSSGKLRHQHCTSGRAKGNCERPGLAINEAICGIDNHSGILCSKAESLPTGLAHSDFQVTENKVCYQNNDLSSDYKKDTLIQEEDDDEADDSNRFYFESDHLALKDNKHYHLLLQTLLVLESQRTQAVKESFNLPSCQKVVKLPSIPWEEYTVSLSAMDRQRLSNPHHTRAAVTQNLAKASEFTSTSSTSDGVENISSDSNMYSVFGGEFVANKRGKRLDRDSLTSVFATKGSDGRNRVGNESKPVTFNQPWTTEEQAKLEKLLQIYPQEEVESKRWEKIANALGNRTLKQVASRVQKYFIKLAKSGLPVPGRMPNLPRTGVRSKRSAHHYQTLGFRNSTFFPSYRPKVFMDEDDDASSVATDDTAGYVSDEDSIPVHLRDTDEYRELMELKRLKKQKIAEAEEGVLHNGFMCDGCGTSPISGTRWHCNECSKDSSVDFCTACIERGNTNIGSHTSEHSLEAINRNSSFFVDGDYVGLSEGSTSAGYNYLDPNFLPSAR
ncbi:ZZ-type zinc finger-containing protein 3-like isoform X4 [Acropora muricata]|uniref:ZZ-type zinc finger-containing protein 3-like isoform X4 n=1 Tax=Acropora muricata TaxID=159855 RepID=UPI0034E4B53F